MKRNVGLEKTLWFSPHCFSWHTWSTRWNKPCNIRLSAEESGRACNRTFRLIWIGKWNILLLFPFKCGILFCFTYNRFSLQFYRCCQNTNEVYPNVKRRAVFADSWKSQKQTLVCYKYVVWPIIIVQHGWKKWSSILTPQSLLFIHGSQIHLTWKWAKWKYPENTSKMGPQ